MGNSYIFCWKYWIISHFKESSIAAGVRRIEAVTGEEAEALSRQSDKTINEMAALLKVPSQKVSERLRKLIEENKEYQAELKSLKQQNMYNQADLLLSKVEKVGDISLLTVEIHLLPEELRLFADALMERLKSAVLLLCSTLEDNCYLILRVSDDIVLKGIKAGEIIKEIAPIIEGSGGGKANSAQAGGKAIHKIPELFNKMRDLIKNKLI